MQLGAPWMARQVFTFFEQGAHFDAVLCSDMLDVATFRALLAGKGITLPIAVYFHENQCCYPQRQGENGWQQFAHLNFTTALTADRLAFNSQYNRESFCAGITKYLKNSRDMRLLDAVGAIREKSTVLYPGIDCAEIDGTVVRNQSSGPFFVWNHRWEHDKGPEEFCNAIVQLAKSEKDFSLVLLGEQFRDEPAVFKTLRKTMGERILHCGYVKNRRAYLQWLGKGTHVVSTAKHEFFGISVMEAVRAGCVPIVPDKLSYRELYPEKYRYGKGELVQALAHRMKSNNKEKNLELQSLTKQYCWQNLAEQYAKWLGVLH